jgi:predicted CoA-substrate-specific enzyme activase
VSKVEGVLKVGIDVGSTTIKLIALDEQNHILAEHYARHFSEIPAALHDNLQRLHDIVGSKPFTFALTGSAGMGIAQRLHLPFVQEVIAAATAVKELIPQTDTVVELGGEDAKIMYFGAAPEERMNGVCAGGTGAFIDHMASLLHTDADGLNALAAKGKQIYTIASRCGVFAKTDIQSLMNDGASKADIALSILQAVVNQTIGNLAQGRQINGNVAFLGGPLHFLPELKKRFIATLKMQPKSVVPVNEGCYFVAMGAALSDESKAMTYADLFDAMEGAKAAADKPKTTEFGLFDTPADYAAFTARHAKDKVAREDLASYSGPIYLGVDAGSTTTKIVAVGDHKQILYTDYGSNEGSPLKVVVREISEFYTHLPKTCYIAGVLTTGYGEGLVKAALHADAGEVETFAHFRAAQEFCPEVTCVLDIGGQDMKCFQIKDGNIGKITLNEACSAGCGSFIQNFAEGLHLTAAEFAARAKSSKAPVDLGTRCTVFMNSRVKQAQKEGAPLADISAGIAVSVIKNALFKVMQLKDVSELGDHIVVQGGTFYNDAVLRSMELLLGKDVIRPDIAGLMGAYGAAILALEKFAGAEHKSTLLAPETLAKFTATSSTYHCQGCGNHCQVTVQRFSDGTRYFTGNRCERGEGKPKNEHKAPNIYAYKYERLFDHYRPVANAKRGKIGLPRVLNMYEDYPFWFTFFTKLGYEVILSGHSSASLYYKGMTTVPSDSLCYPAKLVHGHIMDLVEKGVSKIFYPCIPYNLADTVNKSDNHYNCPVVASYPENIRTNMEVLQKKQIKFMEPFLPINDPKRMEKRLVSEMAAEQVSANEVKNALAAAYAELEQYKEDVRTMGSKIFNEATAKGKQIILLVGRPYHIDPEINHGIPEMIQSYDLPILSEDSVYHLPVPQNSLQIVNQWSYHARLYHAAAFAAAHSNVTLIQLSSFGCGLDAITTGQVKSILERHNRIYTLIKLDEVSNVGAARIRLRSLLAVLSRRAKPVYHDVQMPDRAYFTPDCKQTHTILAPQMAPIHFAMACRALKKYGYNMVVPTVPRRESIDLGLRYVNNDMCYPAIVVIGQMLAALKSGKYDPNHTSIMWFQTCGACRATNYMNLMREALKNAGYPQVPVFACYGRETDAFKLTPGCTTDVAKGMVYADLLMAMEHRMRPYEITAGTTRKVFDKWLNICLQDLDKGGFLHYSKIIKAMVAEFDAIPIDEKLWKPKVGIVGEILTKYHPVANNNLEKVLDEENAEVVMPSLIDFLLYMAYDPIIKNELLDGTYFDKIKGQFFIQLVEFVRGPMTKALSKSKHFTPPMPIQKIAELAKRHVSLGNMAGEGWFLTGEMVKLIESGVPNIVCLQPFACLANHITGKGMFRIIRQYYPSANIVSMDCDAGASEVNQLNRLKLMLAVAREANPNVEHDLPGTGTSK